MYNLYRLRDIQILTLTHFVVLLDISVYNDLLLTFILIDYMYVCMYIYIPNY